MRQMKKLFGNDDSPPCVHATCTSAEFKVIGAQISRFWDACAGNANKTLNMLVHLVAPVAPSRLDVKRQQAGGGGGWGWAERQSNT